MAQEKSIYEQFKNWVSSGTSEASAMDLKVFMKVFKQLVKTAGKKSPGATSKEIEDVTLNYLKRTELGLKKNYPKSFFGPIKSVRTSETIPGSSEDFVAFYNPVKKEMVFHPETLTKTDPRHIMKTIAHEAVHGGQFNPWRFIAVKKNKRIPIPVVKLLSFIERSPTEDFYAQAGKAINRIYHEVSPIERHARKQSEEIIKAALGAARPKTKKKDFLSYFYQDLEREILTTPSLLSKLPKYKKYIDSLIRRYEIQEHSLAEWQNLFKEIN